MRKTLVESRVFTAIVLFAAVCASDVQAQADLTIDSAEIRGDSTLLPHREVLVYFEVTNSGDEDSGDYWLRFYLSDDEDITEDDDWRASRGASSLSPGATYSDYRYVDLPTDIRRGDYYIGVMIIDQDDTVVTTNIAGSITIIRPTDLHVVSVYVDSSSVRPGGQLDVWVGIANEGIGISDYFTIDCYVDDYLIGSDDFGPLAPDESRDFTVYCEIPSDISADNYYIRSVVSCDYDEESGNNEGESDSIWIGGSVDIAFESVQVAAAAYPPDKKFIADSIIINTSGRDSESYTVDYYASADISITKEDHHIGHVERDGLWAGEKDSFETKCRVPYSIPAGHYYIGIIVTAQDEDDPANNVGHSETTIEVVHPSGYVCGHVDYHYTSNWDQTFPIRYALLQLFEADDNDNPLDDRLILETHTDPNGDYAITLPNDPNIGNEIYLKVLAEGFGGAYPGTTSKICVVKDDVLDETYSLVSNVHPHPRDASVVINMRTIENGEFIVFDSAIEGFIKARTFFDIELEQATVYWPSEADASYYDPCDSGIYISQGDCRDRDVIMHEYGHYLAEIIGVAQGPVGENAIHYWDYDLRDYPVARTNKHAMNLAFREGWASLFSIATQFGNTEYPGAGDSIYDDQEGTWTIKVDLDNIGEEKFIPGQYFENMNAGVLWDIFDDKDDDINGKDTISDPSLEMILTISRDYKPENISDFWNNWFQKYEYEQEMEYIFNTHNMWFSMPE